MGSKSRPTTARSSRRSPTRSAVSFSRSVRPNSCQTRNSVQQMHYSTPSQLNNDTIANFEQVLDSARSLREAPLTEHQLSLTQQLKDIGAAGYGNKHCPTLVLPKLTVSDNLITENVDQFQTTSWSQQIET